MLSIFGIGAIVFFTIRAYKTAAGTERNAVGWAAAILGVGIGLQFILPIMIGLLFAIYLALSGEPVDLEGRYFGLMTIIGVVGIGLSIVGMTLVMKHLSRVKDDGSTAAPPPPPPPVFDRDL